MRAAIPADRPPASRKGVRQLAGSALQGAEVPPLTPHDLYRVLRDGGTALVPTTAGYGLVAIHPEAVDRIFALKGRPAEKPCVAVVDAAIFADLVEPVPDAVRAWIDEVAAWSPLAVVAPMSGRSRVLAAADPRVLARCTSGRTIAAYHCAGPFITAAAALAFADGLLIVGSSANASGTGNRYTVDEVPEHIRAGVDAVVDHGPLPPHERRLAATIVQLPEGRFLRQGLHYERIRASWEAMHAA